MKVTKYIVMIGCIFILMSCSNKKIDTKELKEKATEKWDSLPDEKKTELIGSIKLDKVIKLK